MRKWPPGDNMPPLVAKRLIFNGQSKEVFGSIVRVATVEDKAANKVPTDADYLLVDFNYGKVEYRGLWKRDECLLVG